MKFIQSLTLILACTCIAIYADAQQPTKKPIEAPQARPLPPLKEVPADAKLATPSQQTKNDEPGIGKPATKPVIAGDAKAPENIGDPKKYTGSTEKPKSTTILPPNVDPKASPSAVPKVTSPKEGQSQ